MSALQEGPGWEDQVVLSGYNAVRECTTGRRDNIVSLIWWILAGTCMWYAPQILVNWLDVRLSDLFPPFLGNLLI